MDALRVCVCGVDNIRNTHAMHGGEKLASQVAQLASLLRLTMKDRGLTAAELKHWFNRNVLNNTIATALSDYVQQLSRQTHECLQKFADVPLCSREPSANLLSAEGPSALHCEVPILFPVHKCILTCCEYFSAMFRPPWPEAVQASWLRIVVVDCSSSALKVILESLYTDT